MKKQHYGLTLAASALLSSMACAGTMGPVADRYDWTGFYVGGVVGGVWVNDSISWTPVPFATSGASAIAATTNANSVIGGVVGGFNFQFNPSWLAGVDADFSWANARGVNSQLLATTAGSPLIGTTNTMSSKLNWLPSLRARLGYLFTPQMLIYVAGGASWANFSYSATTSNGVGTAPNGFLTNAAFSKTTTGYNVGAGLEYALSSNFMARVEYLYYNFNSAQNVLAANAVAGGVAFSSNYGWSNSYMNSVRGGLTYKF